MCAHVCVHTHAYTYQLPPHIDACTNSHACMYSHAWTHTSTATVPPMCAHEYLDTCVEIPFLFVCINSTSLRFGKPGALSNSPVAHDLVAALCPVDLIPQSVECSCSPFFLFSRDPQDSKAVKATWEKRASL